MISSQFRKTLGLLVGLAGLVIADPALAQNDRPVLQEGHGMEAHLFRSAVDTKGHFAVDATPVLPHLDISLGLLLDFGFDNWFAVEAEDPVYNRTKIDTYVHSVLLFNLGLWNMASVGLSIPLIIPSGTGYDLTTVSAGSYSPQTSKWSTNGGIGDLGIHAKIRWLGADEHLFGVGTVIKYHLPTSQHSEWLMSETGAGAFSGRMIVDSEPLDWYRFAINLGVRIPLGGASKNNLRAGSDPSVPPDNDDGFGIDGDPASPLLFNYGPMLTFGVGQSFTIWPKVLDLVIEVYGNQLMGEFGNSSYFSAEIDAGFKVFIMRNSYLLAGYAHGLPFSSTESKYGFQTAEQRVFIGFAFEPNIGDRDRDGVKDRVDNCPEEPEDRDDFEDTDGCPDADNDRDGVPDVEDDCPLIAGDRNGNSGQVGCSN